MFIALLLFLFVVCCFSLCLLRHCSISLSAIVSHYVCYLTALSLFIACCISFCLLRHCSISLYRLQYLILFVTSLLYLSLSSVVSHYVCYVTSLLSVSLVPAFFPKMQPL